MLRRLRFRPRAALTLALCLATVDSLQAEVRLTLSSGRTIRGDRLTAGATEERVDLRIERAGMTLTRHLVWNEVVTAAVDGVAIDPFELRRRIGSESSSSSANPAVSLVSKSARATQFSQPELPPIPMAPFESLPPAFEPCPLACEPIVPLWLAPPLPVESVILGVREDPLAAYADLAAQVYPNGIPVNEAGFALWLLRDLRAAQAWQAISFPPPGPSRIDAPGPETPSAPPTLPAPDALPLPRTPPPPPPSFDPSALRPGLRPRATVASIAADAIPVNRSARATWDALAVELVARDADGRPVPVEGTLRATLWGQSQRILRSAGTDLTAAPQSLVRLAHWSQRAASGTAANGVAANVTLPLTNPLPDEDLGVAAFGDLHLEWLVPGHGTFETIVTDVPLRRTSPTSVRSLIDTGSAALPGVTTVRGRRAGGLGFFSPSTVVPDRRVLAVQP